MSRQRVAIIGGGAGGISAAWALSSQGDYDITVYQMGWRLGGKGASGRGPNGRIQEHGLHIWLGFYENAFRAMREVFAEVTGEPRVFQSVEDAFEAHDLIGVMERIHHAWRPWLVNFPKRPGAPGDGAPRRYRTIWDLMVACLEALRDWAEDEIGLGTPSLAHQQAAGGIFGSILAHTAAEADHVAAAARAAMQQSALHAAVAYARAMSADPARHRGSHQDMLLALLDHFLERMKDLVAKDTRGDDGLRRVFTVSDLAVATMRGLMAQQVMIDARGFDVLDDMDWQTFFKTYGASPDSYEAHKSAPVRAFYDLVFGYEDGDTTRPNFAAGAALRSVISIVLLYKGSVFMKMRAGMGDTIFAPFYKALVKRGVRFEYFHRLDRIELGEADGAPVVQALHFGRQATVRGGAYQPFVAVDGLDCWPQAPLTDQLVEGEALLKGPDGGGTEGWDGNWKGYDLEDFWTTWPDAGKVTLNRGEAFDLVVLAVPPASHRFIAKELIDTFPRWATMVEKVGSVRTMAMQLWLKSDITGLGWPHGSVVLDAYQQPMNTWADMSHLIPRESWPATATPGSIAYFCGPMAGGLPAPGSTDPSGKATAEVETVGNAWLASATGTLWPQGSIGAGLDPKELVVDVCTTGTGLLHGQYFRANIAPSERYVLSLKGTTEARIDAHEIGCANLFVAGDWTRNGFNAGCVEASIMSGLRAGRAICGRPLDEGIETYW